jgi:hypothetical protein
LVSPGRGARVVWLTEKAKVRGWEEKRRERRVDFPVPEGPETTRGRGSGGEGREALWYRLGWAAKV